MLSRISRKLTTLFLGALLADAPLFAQSTTGSFQGTVKDEQGAVVPGATVTVRNVDTNARRVAVTDSQGRWRVPNLPVGNYEVSLDLVGFAGVVRSGLTLALNQDAVVDLSLWAATVTETITVEADAPLLNTTNAEVGVRFDTKRIAELPVDALPEARASATSSASRCPPPASASSRAASPTSPPGTNFSVNGMRPRGEQLHDRRPGQQRPERHRPPAAHQQHRHRPGDPAHHQPVRRRVRARRGLGPEHRDQERHQRVPRLRLLVREPRRAELPQQPQQERPASPRLPSGSRTSSAAPSAGPVVRDRPSSSAPTSAGRTGDSARASRSSARPTEAGRQALQRARAAARRSQALLQFLPAGTGFVTNAHLHDGRPDLHRSPRLAHRHPRRYFDEQPGTRAGSTSCSTKPHALRPLPLQRPDSGGTGR